MIAFITSTAEEAGTAPSPGMTPTENPKNVPAVAAVMSMAKAAATAARRDVTTPPPWTEHGHRQW
nr:hypothetical protein [Microbispora rosea]